MNTPSIPEGLRLALHNLRFAQANVQTAMAEVDRQLALASQVQDLPSFPHHALDTYLRPNPVDVEKAMTDIVGQHPGRLVPWPPTLDLSILNWISTTVGTHTILSALSDDPTPVFISVLGRFYRSLRDHQSIGSVLSDSPARMFITRLQENHNELVMEVLKYLQKPFDEEVDPAIVNDCAPWSVDTDGPVMELLIDTLNAAGLNTQKCYVEGIRKELHKTYSAVDPEDLLSKEEHEAAFRNHVINPDHRAKLISLLTEVALNSHPLEKHHSKEETKVDSDFQWPDSIQSEMMKVRAAVLKEIEPQLETLGDINNDVANQHIEAEMHKLYVVMKANGNRETYFEENIVIPEFRQAFIDNIITTCRPNIDFPLTPNTR